MATAARGRTTSSPQDAHGPGTAGAHGDVDAEDASLEASSLVNAVLEHDPSEPDIPARWPSCVLAFDTLLRHSSRGYPPSSGPLRYPRRAQKNPLTASRCYLVVALDFDVDHLDRLRARAEARARLFASPDRVALGRYRLLARIGAGSWGTVYRAFDPLMSRPVAVKVMHGHTDAGSDAVARWRREAQLLAKLDHPNVIGIYDVGMEDGRAYLVTALVHDGCTLTQWCARPTRDLDELLQRFAALADALSVIHAHGVLHRDIKPDNILVDPAGEFRLVDFGLAAELRDLEVDGPTRFEGTPAFLPPEVRRGAPPDARADLYSLCGSLWFAVCGAAFPKGTPPRRLQRFFEVGLATRPEHRFATAAALQRALQRVMGTPRAWPRFFGSLGAALVLAAVALPATAPASSSHQAHAPDSKAAIELALAETRRREGANASAAPLLESAFFRASATDEADTASLAALARLEVAVETGDRWGSEVWEAEARVWHARRSSPDPDLSLRFATAASKSLALRGHPREALQGLPEPSAVMDAVSPAVAIAFSFHRGELLNQQGAYDDGLQAFEEADALANQHYPSAHPLRRSARWNLAATQFERGNLVAATEGFEELLHNPDGAPPLPAHELAELQRNLGASYFHLGDIERGLAHTEAALATTQSEYGEAHPRTLDTLQNLAAMLHQGGRHDEAKATAWKAILATEVAYGPDDPRLSSMLQNLAVMHFSPEEAADAEALLRRAEEIVRTHRGPTHRELAMIHGNLARVLRLRGDLPGSLKSAALALDIDEAALGPEHPALAESLLLLARLEHESGRTAEAEAHTRRARALPSVEPVADDPPR